MAEVMVLGAGVAGVSVALHLAFRGWKVTLVDRKGPGQGTSFGNAGIIQAEAHEPYAMPRQITEMLKIACGLSNDVRYDIAGILGQAGALFSYWRHSAPNRHRAIAQVYAGLIDAATEEHQYLIERSGAGNLIRRDGYRMLAHDQRELDAAAAEAERMRRDHGTPFVSLTPAELAAAEPALKFTGAGGLHWPSPWSVSDPGALTAAYAGALKDHGGRFLEGDAASLRRAGAGWQITTAEGLVEAEHAVVALGPWSPELLAPLGLRFPMIRKRGYHRHYRMEKTLDIALLDMKNGFVMAPMTQGLRITSGAELAARNAAPSPRQLERAESLARELLDLGEPVEETAWMGTRPCMADMLPVVGPAPGQDGLWLHFGHGHQGLTLGPVTGRMLAEEMSGERPFHDLSPLSATRF